MWLLITAVICTWVGKAAAPSGVRLWPLPLRNTHTRFVRYLSASAAAPTALNPAAALEVQITLKGMPRAEKIRHRPLIGWCTKSWTVDWFAMHTIGFCGPWEMYGEAQYPDRLYLMRTRR